MLRLLLALVCALALVGCGGDNPKPTPTPSPTPTVSGPPYRELPPLRDHLPKPARAKPQAPNIVFVLTDDLDWPLVRFMPQAQRLARHGMTLRRFFAADSLCCVSRASIYTGLYPHNTGVLTNGPPRGGYFSWLQNDMPKRSFAVSLAASGYRTAMLGKYLNGYKPPAAPDPGWSEWLADSTAYENYNYQLSDNGRTARYGSRPGDYLTDVIAARGEEFIRGSVAAKEPFLAMFSTFTPHRPATSPPRHQRLFKHLPLPKDGTFNQRVENPPGWLGLRRSLDDFDRRKLQREYRARVRSVQSIDELLGRVRRLLKELRVADNTYVVFTSDNGYHMGGRRLTSGKRTAYDSDIRVPFIVAGPGVKRGSSSRALASNVDIAPTFLHWAGAKPGVRDGRSLADVLAGKKSRRWRTAVLAEHFLPKPLVGPAEIRRRFLPLPVGAVPDPDVQNWRMGVPGTYKAIRTDRHLYVEHTDGSRELYDTATDPFELHNIAGLMSKRERRVWHRRLWRLAGCSGASCRNADRAF